MQRHSSGEALHQEGGVPESRLHLQACQAQLVKAVIQQAMGRKKASCMPNVSITALQPAPMQTGVFQHAVHLLSSLAAEQAEADIEKHHQNQQSPNARASLKQSQLRCCGRMSRAAHSQHQHLQSGCQQGNSASQRKSSAAWSGFLPCPTKTLVHD